MIDSRVMKKNEIRLYSISIRTNVQYEGKGKLKEREERVSFRKEKSVSYLDGYVQSGLHNKLN